MRTFRLSKSRITAGLQCGKRLWLAVHRPELEAYTAELVLDRMGRETLYESGEQDA